MHKLNGIDGASYSFEAKTAFARGMSGVATVTVNKDRPGFVRPHAEGRRIAEMHADSSAEDGSVTIELRPPVASKDWRPTVLMERISILLEGSDGPLNVREIREGVDGATKHKTAALKYLVEDGYVRSQRDGREVLHTSLKPFRDSDSE